MSRYQPQNEEVQKLWSQAAHTYRPEDFLSSLSITDDDADGS